MKNRKLIEAYKNILLEKEFSFLDPSTWAEAGLEAIKKFIGDGKSDNSGFATAPNKTSASAGAGALVKGDRASYNQYLDSLSGMSRQDQQSAAIRARAMAFQQAREEAANLKSKALDNADIRRLRKDLEDARAARDANPTEDNTVAAQAASKNLKAKEKELMDSSGATQMARRREGLRSGSLNIVPQEKPDYSRPPKDYVNRNSAEARLRDSGTINPDGSIAIPVEDEFGYLDTPAGRAAALADARKNTEELKKELEAKIAKEPPFSYPSDAARGAEMTSMSDAEFENKFGVNLPTNEPFSRRGGELVQKEKPSPSGNAPTIRPFARRAGSGEFPPIPDRPTPETFREKMVREREKKARMDKIKSDSAKRPIKVFPSSPDRPTPETNEERRARISNDLRRARGASYRSGIAPEESDY
jgi:hypothetical protein